MRSFHSITSYPKLFSHSTIIFLHNFSFFILFFNNPRRQRILKYISHDLILSNAQSHIYRRSRKIMKCELPRLDFDKIVQLIWDLSGDVVDNTEQLSSESNWKSI